MAGRGKFRWPHRPSRGEIEVLPVMSGVSCLRIAAALGAWSLFGTLACRADDTFSGNSGSALFDVRYQNVWSAWLDMVSHPQSQLFLTLAMIFGSFPIRDRQTGKVLLLASRSLSPGRCNQRSPWRRATPSEVRAGVGEKKGFVLATVRAPRYCLPSTSLQGLPRGRHGGADMWFWPATSGRTRASGRNHWSICRTREHCSEKLNCVPDWRSRLHRNFTGHDSHQI